MNEGKVKIAVSLIPLMRYLYNAGIICVGGSSDDVHVDEEFFRSTFPIYEAVERGDDKYRYELRYTFEGVKFFCLTNEV